jgi:hypothetical protein
LERAGATLLAYANRCFGRSCGLPVDVCRIVDVTRRPPLSRCPTAVEDLALQEMRQTFRWIDHIDRDCTMIRRCVAGRAMVDGRGVHLNSWCRLGRLLRADVRTVRRWHAEGLLLIVSQLGGRSD